MQKRRKDRKAEVAQQEPRTVPQRQQPSSKKAIAAGSLSSGGALRPCPQETWPAGVVPISDYQFSPHLKANDTDVMQCKHDVQHTPCQRLPAQDKKLTQIRHITDPKHPACGQRGLFAKKRVPRGTYILDYIGYVEHSSRESKTSDYIIHFEGALSCDAERVGNSGRFVNDYRGTGAERPNLEFKTYRDAKGRLRLGVFALQDIPANSELLVTYGRHFWTARRPPDVDNTSWMMSQ